MMSVCLLGKYAGFIAASLFLGRFFGWYVLSQSMYVWCVCACVCSRGGGGTHYYSYITVM